MGVMFCYPRCSLSSTCVFTAPGSHIERLYARWESALSEEKRLKEHIAEMDARHEEDLKLRLDAQLKSMEEKQVDAVEKARLEGQLPSCFAKTLVVVTVWCVCRCVLWLM